jgi:hypothetical protein
MTLECHELLTKADNKLQSMLPCMFTMQLPNYRPRRG